MKPSSRSQIAPFYAMEAFREATHLAASGRDIVHLSLGQPAARPPQAVLDHVSQMAAVDNIGYTDSRGIEPLRQRIACHYHEQYSLEIDPARIFVTVGSSAAYMLALLCVFDVGNDVAIASPYYAASPNMMRALGLNPVIISTDASSNYHPTLDMIVALPRKPAGLVIASPSNPTGTVMDSTCFEAIVRYCDAEGIRVISDEIYHGVTYDGVRADTILQWSHRMIVTNSFSKYYLLPGWRLGWCVLPEDCIRPAESLLQNFFISAPSLSQHAALAVMDERAALDAVVSGYADNRNYLVAELPKAGFTQFASPQGAFYLYADVGDLTDDSMVFCQKMLVEAGVCAVPGIDFDAASGRRYVRFSYAGDMAAIREACVRLADWRG